MRVVFEKPFGTSYETAVDLNRTLHSIMREDQIFRLDHYLGEGPFRTCCTCVWQHDVRPTWDNHIDCITITMSENFGVDDRGSFTTRRHHPRCRAEPPPSGTLPS